MIVDTTLLALLKDLILIFVHIICHHGVMFRVIFEIEVILVSPIACELWLIHRNKVLHTLAIRDCCLLRLESHHLLNHLKLGHLSLRDFNRISFFIDRHFFVHTDQALEETLIDMIDVDSVTHMVADDALHLFLCE